MTTSVFLITSEGFWDECKTVATKPLDGAAGECVDVLNMESLVGGYIEPVVRNREGGKFYAYVNDDGYIKNMPKNELATRVLDYLDFGVSTLSDDYVRGNAVIVTSGLGGLDPDTVDALSALCGWFKTHSAAANPDLTEEQLHSLFNHSKRRPKRTIAEAYDESDNELAQCKRTAAKGVDTKDVKDDSTKKEDLSTKEPEGPAEKKQKTDIVATDHSDDSKAL